MATVTTVIGTGETYTTVQAWENDLGTTTGGAGNDAVGELKAQDYALDGLTIDNTTPDSITLTAPAGARHAGIEAAAGNHARFTATVGGSNYIYCNTGNTPLTIEWVEIDESGQDWTAGIRNDGDLTVRGCIIHGGSATDATFRTTYIFQAAAGSGKSTVIERCILYSLTNVNGGAGAHAQGINDAGAAADPFEVYNCTIDNINSTGDRGDGIVVNNTGNAAKVVKNTTGSNCKSAAFPAGEGSMTLNNNASDDGTHWGTSGVTWTTDTDEFENPASQAGTEDYHLISTSNLIGAGEDLTTTANVDIDGTDVNASGAAWDIGADQGVFTIDVTLTQVTETDSSNAASQGPVTNVSITQVVEVLEPAELPPKHSVELAQVTETDTSVQPDHLIVIEAATETDSSTAMATRVVIDPVSETDESQAVTLSLTQRIVDAATESDSAVAPSSKKEFEIAQVTDTASPFAFGKLRDKPVPSVLERSTVQTLSVILGNALAFVEDTSVAHSISPVRIYSVSSVSETETPQTLVAVHVAELGIVTDTEAAQVLTSVHLAGLATAEETDSAVAATTTKLLALGLVSSADEARAIAAVFQAIGYLRADVGMEPLLTASVGLAPEE